MLTNSVFTKKYALGLAATACFFFAWMLYFFFLNLNTGSSDYTAGGVTATIQFFYNFLNGLPFQTSLYAIDQGLGFHNQYAYLNTYAIHINLIPFLFSPIWNIWPTISWLNGIIFIINYSCMAIFAWKTLRLLSPNSYKIKFIVALGLTLSSGFLFTFQQNAQFLLFSGPFILGAYYFLLIRQKNTFILFIIMLCMISEDAAMVALTFSLYVYLFERDAKHFALWAGTFSFIYLTVTLLIIQPAARAELELTSSTTTMVVFNHILKFIPDLNILFVGFSPVLFFIPAFLIIRLVFGRPEISLFKMAGLVLLSPLPHWGESAVVGASHHLMPIVVFLFAGFITTLGKTPDTHLTRAPLQKEKLILVLALTILFFMSSFRILISNLPEEILPNIYRIAGKIDRAHKIERSIAYRKDNQRILAIAREIPKQNSLVFWTNSSIGGYIADRSHVWPFPNHYDLVDYLLLQPDAHQSFFYFLPKSGDSLNDAIKKGIGVTLNDAEISKKSVELIIQNLVLKEKSHRIVVEEPGIVLLERIRRELLYVPRSTIGFGWVDNIGKQIFSQKKEKQVNQ